MSVVGWDNQEELDYSKIRQDSNSDLPILPIVRKSSMPTDVENWQRRPSGD